ncbi:MAG: TonB-dependent receptor [Rhizobiales bacterium]|nr:TonB-dependent receptor [Hyphomicrobiales bacterium]
MRKRGGNGVGAALLTGLLGGASVLAGAVSATQSANAQVVLEGILITGDTAGGAPVAGETVGTAFTVITGEQLQQQGIKYASDALRQVPGVAVSRTGSFGELTQIRIRGAEGNHVLVLVDGVEVADPSQGEFDFSSLLTENIERIEVLRGAQSALWGADALAGVINIVTKAGSRGTNVQASFEAGSFDTYQGSGRIAHGNDLFRFALSGTQLSTNGFDISEFGRTIADPTSEDDGYVNRTLSFKGDIDLLPFFNVSAVLRHVDRLGDADDQDFTFGSPTQGFTIDRFSQSGSKEAFARVEATLSTFQDHWEHAVYFSMSDIERENFNDLGRFSSGNSSTRETTGYRSTLKFDTPELLDARHTIVELYEQETETFRNTAPTAVGSAGERRERMTKSLVGEYRLSLLDSIFLTAAVRSDDFDGFDDAVTYRTTGAYVVRETGTRLHASYGEGVKPPSFFEQFGFVPDTFDGNPNLVPETSVSWDVGIEQRIIPGILTVDVTYFEANLDNEIFSTFSLTPTGFRSSVANEDEESTREGIEVSLTATPTDWLSIKGSYTYLEAFENRNGVRLLEVRRPQHSGSLDIFARFLDGRARANLGIVYNGEMDDLEFVNTTPQTRITLPEYTVVRLGAEYDLSDQITWYARGENVFNEDYQEVYTFETAGASFYTGIRMNLSDVLGDDYGSLK